MNKKINLCLLLTTHLLTISGFEFNPEPIKIDYCNAQDTRKEKATGEERTPQIISLAIASSTKERAVNLLEQYNLFYNIIIDLVEHKTYYFTDDSAKDIEEACKTIRPRAVGVSAYTDAGFMQRRDLNSESIAIGIIRDSETFNNAETYRFFVDSLAAICDIFEIQQHKIFSYPLLAIRFDGTYGRQSFERHEVINFKKLAEYGFGLWPYAEDFKIIVPFTFQEESVRWVAQALNKIGMFAAVTENNEHPQLKSAIMAFQKHYQLAEQEGIVTEETILALNSILKQKEAIELKLQEIEPLRLIKYNERKYKEFKPIVRALIATVVQKRLEEEKQQK